MSYRKLKADYLFDGHNMRGTEAVLICRLDGTIEKISDENEAGSDLEIFSGMLVPGFINCHCHLELSHLKGQIPPDQGLVNFLLSVIKQRYQPEEIRKEAIRNAEEKMLQSGIVAVGDICNTIDTGDLKSLKHLLYYNFIELLGWTPEQASSRYEEAESLAEQFKKMGLDGKHLSLNPHAPYSVSGELWNLMKPGFKTKTVTIHNQESAAENEFFMSGKGDLVRLYAHLKMNTDHFKIPATRSLVYYLSEFKDASRIMLVHNTFINEEDILETFPFRDKLFFCLCPNANMFIEGRLPDVLLLRKHNAALVFGTDSLASNHQLNILEEIKMVKKNFPSIPSAELLVWATSNGAKVLSFEPDLGDFVKGKKPGIVQIDNIRKGEITELSTSRRLI